MGNRSFYALVLFTVVFTSLLPLSCRLCYYPDMQRILAAHKQSEVYGTLPCKFSAQIPLFSMEVRLVIKTGIGYPCRTAHSIDARRTVLGTVPVQNVVRYG